MTNKKTETLYTNVNFALGRHPAHRGDAAMNPPTQVAAI
jgi:hypothetical protein